MTDYEHEKPDPRAVSLKYDGKDAPRVTAKGEGKLAEQILNIAREHGIPLHEDPDLVNLLAKLELGEEIPRSLYVAIAEVIAFAYIMTGKIPEEFIAK
ncbi:MAG: EscU/YscU/HrcU family type III secretion system export apparatus switch protein [Gammaproteobacteria bacterium]|nr:EscU/YscU/HrcU family type III secretion system export apparatus switch protein [Gammaproteobacteria bacterium]MDH5592894.1 EscU/YscU/HrcU family type III secretion system export apparatus switch protein [Gammaproteobacteria bacterium]